MKNKSGFIWNTIGSLIYSFFNAIVLVFCTRLNGTEFAGIFSICYATGCILNAIGDMGIRIFQVTDTNRKYKLDDYIFSRIIAVSLMLLTAIVFVVSSGYRKEKLFICIILILIRVVDNFSETFQAEFQLNDRLDRAGKAMLYRNFFEITAFAIIDIITKNIYYSFMAMLIIGIVILLGYDFLIINKEGKIKLKFNLKNVNKILRECFPLGMSTLISMYVINAVKYAIDRFGDNTMQTYFNVLYMPTFVINLISILIMKPLLKPFGDYWNGNEHKKFLKTVFLIMVLLCVATVFVEVAAITLGLPILNFIYNIDLSEYKIELVLLILSGLFYASSTVIFYALGTIRKQKYSTVAYIISAIFAFWVSNILVNKYKIFGSAVSSLLVMIVLFVSLLIFFVFGYNKEKGRQI